MRSASLLTAPLFAAALALAGAAPARADIVVNIDKTTQRMSVTVDGVPRYVWPVSTGRAGYDTPDGTFRVNRMDADHLSQEWDNAPMPHAMFFDMHGHAIHGFFDVRHLGQPVSHGCVRIAPANATALFNLVKAEGMQATTVIVTGQTPRPGQYAAQPMDITPTYAQPQPAPYGEQPYAQPGYRQAEQGQAEQGYDGQAPQSYYVLQPQPYYGRPGYVVPQYYVLRPYGRY